MSEPLAVTVHYDLNTDTFIKTQVKIYPNPASTTVTVSGSSVIEHISLLNMLGQEVISDMPNALTTPVDISALQSGAYLIKVKTNAGAGTIKLLKK